MDLSFLLITALIIFSQSNLLNNYLFQWVQTSVNNFTDLFGNAMEYRTIRWNRLLWLCISLAIFSLGLLFTRRYEKNMFQSALYNCRIVVLPLIVILLITGSVSAYAYEPYFDQSPPIKMEIVNDKETGATYSVMSVSLPEDNPDITAENVDLDVHVDTTKALLQGKAKYKLTNQSGKEQTIKLSVNPGYTLKLRFRCQLPNQKCSLIRYISWS
ncbi:hypothetical protein D3C78_1251350 [compost metagenome]